MNYSYNYFYVKISLNMLVKPLLHSIFFHCSLESQNCKQKNLQSAFGKTLPTIGTLVDKLLNCRDDFLRFSGFPDLAGKVSLINFKFS